MDRNHIDEIISSSLEKQLTYDKPSKKGTSYYLKEKMNDDLQGHTINTSGSNEKSTEQCSREPAMKILIHLQIYRTKAVIIRY